MKKATLIISLCLLLFVLLSFRQQQMFTTAEVPLIVSDTLSRDTLIRFEANPAKGFNFPYYIYIPKGTKTGKQFLLVEPNNNGNNDTLAYHDRQARLSAKRQSLGNSISRKLKVPYLVPVFMRPQKEWKIYSHALDRDVMLIKDGDLKRLDLQLIGMIKDATTKLTDLNLTINEKVLMNGFSASGTFVNRFTMIHPEHVAATASGGLNAILILPLKKIKEEKLDYPIGINDVETLFGKPVNLEESKKVPQFIYMGETDNNDAALFDDAYSKKERKQIFNYLGKTMMPDRFNKCKSFYAEAGMNAEVKIYPGIGHGTDRKMNEEIALFFKKIIDANK